jgi:hypothetical protein
VERLHDPGPCLVAALVLEPEDALAVERRRPSTTPTASLLAWRVAPVSASSVCTCQLPDSLEV